MRKLILLALMALFLMPSAAFAKDPRVTQAETWLNNLKTGTARFKQTGYDGRVATGKFFIKRPGKLRFEYDPPLKDFAVADGVMIHYYDSEQNQASSSPISLSLADFLLRKTARLDGDLTVTNIRTKNGIISMAVAQKADEGAGQLILNFTENPYMLHSWIVIDPQGLTTTVELQDFQLGMDLPYGLFVFKDPSGRNRLND